MTEFEHQKAFFDWFRWQYPNVIAFSIPNGEHRNAITGKRLKFSGVLAGVPDIFIADGRPGLFIEMKSEKGALSKVQKAIIPRLKSTGYPVAVCHGFDDAKNVVQRYLSGNL